MTATCTSSGSPPAPPDVRVERDLLGARTVPAGALYGIHTARAIENFPLAGRCVHPALVHAYGAVKLACARTNHELGHLEPQAFAAIAAACEELAAGTLDAHVVVDALQGGAGTSTNMNVNEVIANRARQLLGRPASEHGAIDPYRHVNLHQSTNDTFPTALRVAAIVRLRPLEQELAALVATLQAKEQEFAHVVKLGRTEGQDAVLTTLGRTMSAFAEALGRDRWRIYKCEERLRVVNLGGTAIGTGLGAPRRYIFRVVEQLRAITGIGLARAENLVEATQNADVFVEVSGMLKACATSLLKICGDLRLLASGPAGGPGELRLPARQAGSSIMPGKVNPVIPEAVSQAAIQVIANDVAIAHACAAGSLELNPFLPLIADALLNSLDLLTRAAGILRRHCIAGLAANEVRCREHVANSGAALTALVARIGYAAAEEVAQEMQRSGASAGDILVTRRLLTRAEFEALIAPEAVLRLGSPDDGGRS